MKPILLLGLALCAASVQPAQESLPDARKVLNKQWDGDWRTIEYVLESSSGSLTVAIERPNRLRAELKSSQGWRLMVVSDGESTWVYNSDLKQYARFEGARPPGAWLFRLDELLIRQMTGASDDVLTTRWRNLRTLSSESVQVQSASRECWMIQGSATGLGGVWSTRTALIDKVLLIPLQLNVVNARNESLHARVRSLQVGRPIPSSTFMFAIPGGSREVPTPSHLLSTSMSGALPNGRTLWDQRWTGQWRSIQYTTEASSPLLSSPSVRKVIRTAVTIEKPDNIRIEIQGLKGNIQGESFAGRSVTAVSDVEAMWIFNSQTRQYAKVSRSQKIFQAEPVLRTPGTRPPGSSYVPALSNMDDWVVLQLLASYRIFDNPALLKDLGELAEPMFEPTLWGRRITLRSESIDVAGVMRDCWVVLGEVNGMGPLWGPRIAWIDKELQVPLLFGVVSSLVWNTAGVQQPVFPEEQRFDANGYEPDFVGMRILSLKVDAPIPPGTFTFKPPKGSIEVTPSPRRPVLR